MKATSLRIIMPFLLFFCSFNISAQQKEVQDMRWISRDDDLAAIDFFPGYVDMLKNFFTSRQ